MTVWSGFVEEITFNWSVHDLQVIIVPLSVSNYQMFKVKWIGGIVVLMPTASNH